MHKKGLVLLAVFLIAVAQLCAEKGEGGKQRNRPVWEMTEYQKELPPIEILEAGVVKAYSFRQLIEADGYLCPGSARAYKALLIALPYLYVDETLETGDLKIEYGPSACAEKVFGWFMNLHDGNLVQDESLMGREIIVSRIATDERVHIVFDEPDADGHNPEGAAAGDAVLRAEDGNGMTIVEGSSSPGV